MKIIVDNNFKELEAHIDTLYKTTKNHDEYISLKSMLENGFVNDLNFKFEDGSSVKIHKIIKSRKFNYVLKTKNGKIVSVFCKKLKIKPELSELEFAF